MFKLSRIISLLFISLCVIFIASCSENAGIERAHSISYNEISGSQHYSSNTKKLISSSLVLAKKDLRYDFGSDNPRNGGMDCSGTIHYLLYKTDRIDSPRDASEIYVWLQKDHTLHYVHTDHFHSWAFRDLRPGDLLFWTGTYYTHHWPPITHVMLYIGKNREGEPLMFGASEGIYDGRIDEGVGVFDFQLPNYHDRARFVAYGCIPHFTC